MKGMKTVGLAVLVALAVSSFAMGQEKEITLKGKLKWQTLEGGFWTLKAEGGKGYDLHGDKKLFKGFKSGDEAEIKGETPQGVGCFHMCGTIFQLQSIKHIKEQKEEPRLQKLIEQLGAKEKKERTKAEDELKKLSASALEALEKKFTRMEEFKKVARFTEEGMREFNDHQARVKKLADKIRTELGKQVKELLKQLDDDEVKVRQAAVKKLVEFGKSAKEFVKKAVEQEGKRAKEAKNAEVEERCKQILEELKKGGKTLAV